MPSHREVPDRPAAQGTAGRRSATLLTTTASPPLAGETRQYPAVVPIAPTHEGSTALSGAPRGFPVARITTCRACWRRLADGRSPA